MSVAYGGHIYDPNNNPHGLMSDYKKVDLVTKMSDVKGSLVRLYY